MTRHFIRSIIFIPSIAIGAAMHAQPVLLPSIGIEELPEAAAAICTLPQQTPPLDQNGVQAGVTAADFKLFAIDGTSFHLAEALLAKPVLVIAGSYTCPVFRNKVPLINSIQATYGDLVTTVIVYTAEAHPHIDTSPYSGVVNTHQANFNAGILYQQPTTYFGRMQVAQHMLQQIQIDVPVLIDGPCNEWWEYYGPAPNIAYLIGTDGTIFSRHTWLDKYPQDIVCDIHDLLGQPIDCDQTFGGAFTMEWITNDTVYGPAGTTLTASTRILNPGDQPVLVEVHRLLNDLPAGWNSALCLDVCYTPEVEYAEIVVPAGGMQDFHFYFYAATAPHHGRARVGVRNADDHNNGYMLDLHAFSEDANSIHEMTSLPSLSIWPVPADDLITIETERRYDRITVSDLAGRPVMVQDGGATMDLRPLAGGIYLVQAWFDGTPVSRPVRVLRR